MKIISYFILCKSHFLPLVNKALEISSSCYYSGLIIFHLQLRSFSPCCTGFLVLSQIRETYFTSEPLNWPFHLSGIWFPMMFVCLPLSHSFQDLLQNCLLRKDHSSHSVKLPCHPDPPLAFLYFFFFSISFSLSFNLLPMY